jgi:acetyl-CoA acetyltransferase
MRDYAGVALAAPVTFGYARRSEHEVPWFVGGALAEMIRRAGIAKTEVDGLAVARYRLLPDNAASLCEYLGLSPKFIQDFPYGGASGVMALRRAARAVQAGDAEIVACIGADVPPAPTASGANFSSFSRDHVYPYGAGGPNSVFALITDRYMRENGATREDFGRLCIAQRANGTHFPHALLRTPLTMEEYLAARRISEPLGLFDCVMRCCGAEGFLVMSEDRARSLGVPFARIAASVERHNALADEPVQARVGIAGDAPELWAQAGLGPQDMAFVQAYDDYPVIVMLQLESLGFFAPGAAARLLTDRNLPLNTNGGMLSLGQAGAGGGFAGMTEAIRQLTGQALGAAVPDAKAGVVSCYGTVNYDRGLCSSAAVLTRGRSA